MENSRFHDLYVEMKVKRKISVLLPVFSVMVVLLLTAYYIPQWLAVIPQRYRIKQVILFDAHFYHRIYNKPYPRLRNYQEICFTGNEYTDNIKLDFARIRVREIIGQNDTLHGVHFNFGNSTRYALFIRALDVLYREKAESYIIDNGDIWFLQTGDQGAAP